LSLGVRVGAFVRQLFFARRRRRSLRRCEATEPAFEAPAIFAHSLSRDRSFALRPYAVWPYRHSQLKFSPLARPVLPLCRPRTLRHLWTDSRVASAGGRRALAGAAQPELTQADKRRKASARKIRVSSVTLVVAVAGPKTIWLLADRRLSYGGGRPPKDDARKVMILETIDKGCAILGYSGLGATVRGTEPSDWMSAVLRGRHLLLEQSLGVLAKAMKREFPPHMLQLPGKGAPAHNIVVPAFLGGEPKIYKIGLACARDRKAHAFGYWRHDVGTTLVGVSGTGGAYLQRRGDEWRQALVRAVEANDSGKLSALAVADHFAKLNYGVSRGIQDKSVGTRCVVAWRHKAGGGSCAWYTRRTRDRRGPGLPLMASGVDRRAIFDKLGTMKWSGMLGNDEVPSLADIPTNTKGCAF
jgi:hypothetical protein